MQNEPHPSDCPRCRCCDELIEGTAFCRTCYDRANYQPDSGEINAALLEACQAVLSAIVCHLSEDDDDTLTSLADRIIGERPEQLLRAAIAQATAHTPAPS